MIFVMAFAWNVLISAIRLRFSSNGKHRAKGRGTGWRVVTIHDTTYRFKHYAEHRFTPAWDA